MAKPNSNKNYRHLADELDKILEWFESGEVSIDEALAKYEQANKLIAEMEDYLKNAENRVRQISVKYKNQS